MTETSPVSYQTTLHSPLQKRIETVGTILPHTRAKIVKPGTADVLPIGQRGELCVSGYLLQKGYWENEEKTREVMIEDEEGRLWMMTGDEGSMDKDGYLSITGRIKDIIIRGIHFGYISDFQAEKTYFLLKSKIFCSRIPVFCKHLLSQLQMRSMVKLSAHLSSEIHIRST